jgi:hypothetical protein
MGAFVQALASLGLLDGESGAYSVHDWQERNPWAAEADDRSDKARLSNFLGRFPEAKAELEKAGIKGLSQDQYQEWAEQFKARPRRERARVAPRPRRERARVAPLFLLLLLLLLLKKK